MAKGYNFTADGVRKIKDAINKVDNQATDGTGDRASKRSFNDRQFWARIECHCKLSPNRWQYSWTEVVPDPDSPGDWTDKDNGRRGRCSDSSTAGGTSDDDDGDVLTYATNAFESDNQDGGEQGGGIDLDEIVPYDDDADQYLIPIGGEESTPVVLMRMDFPPRSDDDDGSSPREPVFTFAAPNAWRDTAWGDAPDDNTCDPPDPQKYCVFKYTTTYHCPGSGISTTADATGYDAPQLVSRQCKQATETFGKWLQTANKCTLEYYVKGDPCDPDSSDGHLCEEPPSDPPKVPSTPPDGCCPMNCYFVWLSTFDCTTATWSAPQKNSVACLIAPPYPLGVWTASGNGCNAFFCVQGPSCPGLEKTSGCGDFPSGPVPCTLDGSKCCQSTPSGSGSSTPNPYRCVFSWVCMFDCTSNTWGAINRNSVACLTSAPAAPDQWTGSGTVRVWYHVSDTACAGGAAGENTGPCTTWPAAPTAKPADTPDCPSSTPSVPSTPSTPSKPSTPSGGGGGGGPYVTSVTISGCTLTVTMSDGSSTSTAVPCCCGSTSSPPTPPTDPSIPSTPSTPSTSGPTGSSVAGSTPSTSSDGSSTGSIADGDGRCITYYSCDYVCGSGFSTFDTTGPYCTASYPQVNGANATGAWQIDTSTAYAGGCTYVCYVDSGPCNVANGGSLCSKGTAPALPTGGCPSCPGSSVGSTPSTPSTSSGGSGATPTPTPTPSSTGSSTPSVPSTPSSVGSDGSSDGSTGGDGMCWTYFSVDYACADGSFHSFDSAGPECYATPPAGATGAWNMVSSYADGCSFEAWVSAGPCSVANGGALCHKADAPPYPSGGCPNCPGSSTPSDTGSSVPSIGSTPTPTPTPTSTASDGSSAGSVPSIGSGTGGSGGTPTPTPTPTSTGSSVGGSGVPSFPSLPSDGSNSGGSDAPSSTPSSGGGSGSDSSSSSTDPVSLNKARSRYAAGVHVVVPDGLPAKVSEAFAEVLAQPWCRGIALTGSTLFSNYSSNDIDVLVYMTAAAFADRSKLNLRSLFPPRLDGRRLDAIAQTSATYSPFVKYDVDSGTLWVPDGATPYTIHSIQDGLTVARYDAADAMARYEAIARKVLGSPNPGIARPRFVEGRTKSEPKASGGGCGCRRSK